MERRSLSGLFGPIYKVEIHKEFPTREEIENRAVYKYNIINPISLFLNMRKFFRDRIKDDKFIGMDGEIPYLGESDYYDVIPWGKESLFKIWSQIVLGKEVFEESNKSLYSHSKEVDFYIKDHTMDSKIDFNDISETASLGFILDGSVYVPKSIEEIHSYIKENNVFYEPYTSITIRPDEILREEKFGRDLQPKKIKTC